MGSDFVNEHISFRGDDVLKLSVGMSHISVNIPETIDLSTFSR